MVTICVGTVGAQLPTLSWETIATNGTKPARSGHTGITYNDTMVLFGGYNTDYLNDVYMLKFKSNLQWIQVLPSGTAPSVRYMHSAIYHNMSMVVFGGHDDTNRYNDLFKLNFNTNNWLGSRHPGQGQVNDIVIQLFTIKKRW